MQITGAHVESGLNWRVSLGDHKSSTTIPSAIGGAPHSATKNTKRSICKYAGRQDHAIETGDRSNISGDVLRATSSHINKAAALIVIVRGPGSAQADLSAFQNPQMYPSWSLDPIMCCRSPVAFNGYDKFAAALRYLRALCRAFMTKFLIV